MENEQSRDSSTTTATNHETKASGSGPKMHKVSWFRQFRWCFWKNWLLIVRRPLMLTFVVLGSLLSLTLSWVAGGKGDPDGSIYPPMTDFTDCGSVNPSFFLDLDYSEQEKVRITLNEEWRDGVAVAVMALGALSNATFVFIVVSSEVHAQLLGVLRALGLRDSVFWLSWYAVFAAVSVCNALLGAITAKLLPGHVYESVYFLGIFASLLFLNLALVSASLFVVALCGTSRQLCANFCILLLILAAFIPLIAQSVSSSLPYPSSSNYFTPYPTGLFWQFSSTTSTTYEYGFETLQNGTNITTITDVDSCDVPIMNEKQGKWYKTESQAMDVTIDEFFVGW